jgi:hypothetical protein
MMTPLPHLTPDLVGPDPPCVDMRCVQYTRVSEGEDKFGSIPRFCAVGIGFWGDERDQWKVKRGKRVLRPLLRAIVYDCFSSKSRFREKGRG